MQEVCSSVGLSAQPPALLYLRLSVRAQGRRGGLDRFTPKSLIFLRTAFMVVHLRSTLDPSGRAWPSLSHQATMLSLGSLVTGFAPTTVRPSTINAQMGLVDAVKGIFGDKKQVRASHQTSDTCRSALLEGAPTLQRGRNGQRLHGEGWTVSWQTEPLSRLRRRHHRRRRRFLADPGTCTDAWASAPDPPK